MIQIDAGNYIANLKTAPRWMSVENHILGLIEERKDILSARLLYGEAELAKANCLIGEIRALKEIVLLPEQMAEKGQREVLSGE